ncbi:MAG: inner membrane-spanning protein YciB, partial [Mariprofundaceae bacterium]
FGGATLILQDEMFIKWKPSVINWLFGAVFIGSQFIGKMCIIQRMLGSKLTLPDPIWIKLNIMWAIFFVVLGFINLFVVYNYDTDTWVNFKLFGLTGLMLVFMLIQGIYLARHIKEEPAD